MHEWYYSAADGQHRGPFPAAEMQTLAARGVITASTLVWREGYPQWRPLAEAGELAQPTGLPPALPAAAAVAPTRSAVPASAEHVPTHLAWAILTTLLCCWPLGVVAIVYAARVEGLRAGGDLAGARRASRLAGLWALWSALVMVLLIVPAILVAIALPAYNDYSLRAQSANAIAQAQALELPVVEFLATHGRCPRNGDAGFGSPDTHAYAALAAVDFGQFEGSGRCGLEATLHLPGSPALDGKSIWLEYDSDADRWTCSSDVEDRHLPVGCRG